MAREPMRRGVRLVARKEVARNTIALFLTRPSDFLFTPGQYITLVLPSVGERERGGNRRDFSLASAPFEKEIMLVTRLRESAFKQALGRFSAGEHFFIEGPFGSFGLSGESTKPLVFIAGGIGIAPFMSMARQEAQQGFSRTITLFYSNKKRADAAFFEELTELSRAHKRFAFVPTVTEDSPGQKLWVGERGRIDRGMLERFILDLTLPLYSIAGSPGMSVAMDMLLMDAGVPPEHVRTEDFAGY